VIFFMLAILIHFNSGKFYIISTDPEYFHLFNGLNISIFNLAVDYIAHPGTTLQMIYAWSAHIVNIVEPANGIITNAMNNPEDFIHGANILLNILTGLSIFALGLYTYKYTQNIFLAILLQLMPFSNFKILMISARLLPETVLIAPLILLVLIVVKFLYDEHREEHLKKYLFGFAIIGGLGIAGKLSYLPFLIVPLFLLPSSKLRIKYLLYTFVAIIIFAFPVFTHLGKSWDWFGGMLLHSGKWGSGESNIIETAAIPNRLSILYYMDKSLFILMGIAFLQWVIFYFIPYFRRKRNNTTFLVLKTMGAFLLAISIAVLLVTKHFAAHYFNPFLLLKFFILYLIIELFLPFFKSNKAKLLVTSFVLLIAFSLVIPQVKQLKFSYGQLTKRAKHFNDEAYVLKQYNTIDNPLIISSHYRGSPFIESAMVGGCLMSGPLKSTFIHQLAAKYPNTYFYFDWTDKFYFWDKFRRAKDFVDVKKPLYIFIGEGKEPCLPIIMERIKKDFPDKETKLVLLQTFSKPSEYFYKVNFSEKKELSEKKG